MSRNQVYEVMERKIFEDSRVVAATNHTAAGLSGRGFAADVVIMDETSMITDTAACVPLVDQSLIKLVVMAGDLYQLEPVVVSKKEENPLSAYVGDLVMRMWSAANHQIQLVYLVEDYRRLQELFNLSNELFYDKTLRLALNSPVHQENTIRPAMQAAMAHPQFFGGGSTASCKPKLYFHRCRQPRTEGAICIYLQWWGYRGRSPARQRHLED